MGRPLAKLKDLQRREKTQMEGTKAADHPDRETVAIRQGTGPRATVSVLLISMTCAAVAGLLIAYFVWGYGPPD